MTREQLMLLLGAALVAAFLLALALTALTCRVARRIGFVDQPGGHKSHARPTPYGGGVAIFLAGWLPVLVAALAARWIPADQVSAWLGPELLPWLGGLVERSGQALVLAGGAILLFGLGLYDDLRPLGAWSKLTVIVIAASLAVLFGEIRVASVLGDMLSIPLTIAWLIVIINAFNFLDNMDGLSAGIAWIGIAFLVICGLMAEQVFVPALGCVFLGAIGGFLLLNFPPARIFMGDAGSLVVGYTVATISVLTTYYESGRDVPPYALAMPLIVLAIPLYDFASVLTIRVVEGRNPLRGDQRHFSHRLVDRGLSRPFAVLTIYLATACTGLAATLLPGADWRETLTVMMLVIMVLAIVAILEAPLRKTA